MSSRRYARLILEDGRVVNNNFTNLGLLLKAGYNATKACNSGTQVIIHTARVESGARWFYDGIRAQGEQAQFAIRRDQVDPPKIEFRLAWYAEAWTPPLRVRRTACSIRWSKRGRTSWAASSMSSSWRCSSFDSSWGVAMK